MTFRGEPVSENERSDSFATFFQEKVDMITDSVGVDDSVYNGRRKLVAVDLDFMSEYQVKACIEAIKLKNTEGFDRVPQRVLVDGIDHLLTPLSVLFNLMLYHYSSEYLAVFRGLFFNIYL